jgi:LmbE family N-acetylglucosaminyl deacetylase
MLPLRFSHDPKADLQILCLGAHSDDIEIGCGGTLMQLAAEYPNAAFHWVVFSSGPEREREAHESAALFLKNVRNGKVVVKDFRGSFFPFIGGEIKDYFEEIKTSMSPDVIFTHQRNDLHQDHLVVNQLTWNTFRNHLILEYEICKYDGDLGNPNVFMHLSADTCRQKVDYILSAFKTQKDRAWFTEDTFLSMMRIRGVECNSPSRYAEAFYCRKMVLSRPSVGNNGLGADIASAIVGTQHLRQG